MKTTIEERPAYHVIGLPHKGAYWQIGRTFGQLAEWASKNNLSHREGIAVYHDDPQHVAEADLRSDALMVVEPGIKTPEGMVHYTIPAGKYLVCVHEGSYQALPQAWTEAYTVEMPNAGATPRPGMVLERYVNDCNEVSEAELLTEILIPVA